VVRRGFNRRTHPERGGDPGARLLRLFLNLSLVVLLGWAGFGIAPADAQASSPVGYLGCSMTRDTVIGYHALGGTRLWETIQYGGGAIINWQNSKYNGPYWQKFDAAFAAHRDTGSIFWQLCVSDDSADLSDEQFHTIALSILTQLRSRVGTMPVEISSQPTYVAPHVCPSSGSNGPARMLALANRLVAEGHVQRGPVFPSLRADQLVDRCHPDEVGQRILGNVLAERYGLAGTGSASAVPSPTVTTSPRDSKPPASQSEPSVVTTVPGVPVPNTPSNEPSDKKPTPVSELAAEGDGSGPAVIAVAGAVLLLAGIIVVLRLRGRRRRPDPASTHGPREDSPVEAR